MSRWFDLLGARRYLNENDSPMHNETTFLLVVSSPILKEEEKSKKKQEETKRNKKKQKETKRNSQILWMKKTKFATCSKFILTPKLFTNIIPRTVANSLRKDYWRMWQWISFRTKGTLQTPCRLHFSWHPGM